MPPVFAAVKIFFQSKVPFPTGVIFFVSADQPCTCMEIKRPGYFVRSEEHTSELQSRLHLVCRLLLEKKRYTAERLTSNVGINEPITVTAVAKKILFCAGITTALGLPFYYLKPHWLVIWVGALIYSWRLLKTRRVKFWQAFAILFIVMYLVPLFIVPGVSTYGVRMVLPVMPIALLLGVRSLTLL